MIKAPRELQITSAGAIEHILTHCPHRIRSLAVARKGNRLSKIVDLAREHRISVNSNLPEGVRADLGPFPYTELDPFLSELPKKAVLLVLDHLQDPQNFGAICRSAEALGVSGIIIPKDRSVLVTAGVHHASVGAVETIPIVRVTNLSATFDKLKEADIWLVGTALNAKSTPPSEVPDFDRVALVLGSEYDGMSEKLREKCDWHVKIPLTGNVPSLNVSAAGSILLYELTRRHTLN